MGKNSGVERGSKCHWSPAEVEMLAGLCGDMPWVLVVQTYKAWQSRHGMPYRSETALRRHCERLGIQRRTVGAWITTGTIARMLGVSIESVRRWAEHGWLPARRFGDTIGHLRFVRRSDLLGLARERPELFGGCSAADLTMLLEDEGLAERIAEHHPRRRSRPVAVVCRETGERFPSLRAAAARAYVSPERMRTAVKTGGAANGLHWRAA